jgi:hypothetical protein
MRLKDVVVVAAVLGAIEEATFYLRSCPGTQMDGDNDGIPCESQHCGH